jgi:hypothetical protein
VGGEEEAQRRLAGRRAPAHDHREYPAVLVDRLAALSVSAGSASFMGDRMGDRSRSVLKPNSLSVDLLDFPRRRWTILAETISALSAESDQKTEFRPNRVAFKRTTYRSVDRRDYGGGWRREWDSNPRTPVKMLLEFQSSAFDRSAISPINYL